MSEGLKGDDRRTWDRIMALLKRCPTPWTALEQTDDFVTILDQSGYQVCNIRTHAAKGYAKEIGQSVIQTMNGFAGLAQMIDAGELPPPRKAGSD